MFDAHNEGVNHPLRMTAPELPASTRRAATASPRARRVLSASSKQRRRKAEDKKSPEKAWLNKIDRAVEVRSSGLQRAQARSAARAARRGGAGSPSSCSPPASPGGVSAMPSTPSTAAGASQDDQIRELTDLTHTYTRKIATSRDKLSSLNGKIDEINRGIRQRRVRLGKHNRKYHGFPSTDNAQATAPIFRKWENRVHAQVVALNTIVTEGRELRGRIDVLRESHLKHNAIAQSLQGSCAGLDRKIAHR